MIPPEDPFDWIRELDKLLGEAGLSFSANCCSGLIGRKRCCCWRCLEVAPESEAPAWADVVPLLKIAHREGVQMGILAEREGIAAPAEERAQEIVAELKT